jgi:folate-binding Fe-S cluster repair protein YgfZ
MENPAITPTNEPVLWSRIVVTGTEVSSFLQGQLTQDVTRIGDGGSWSLLLAPDSVVIASCLVTRLEDGYVLTIERELAEASLRRLRRFLLRASCSLELSEADAGPFASLEERVRRGWPGAAEFAAGLTPHTFGAAFVGATISFTKGCFTGQELVGRLDARGSSVPWRLVRATGPNREVVDEVLRSKGPEGPQGLTTVVQQAIGVIGLGFAHRTLLGESPTGESTSVTIEPIG